MKMIAKIQSGFTLIALLLSTMGFSQINHPKASPFTKVEQEVGLSKITLEYSRPAVRGRKIFGALVPYGRIWRVGANESTKITLDTDAEVMGNNLPAGTYALYAFPEKDSWQIVFHKNTTHWGDGRKNYNPEQDAFRITIKPEISEVFQENFLITFDSITHNTVNMLLYWENTKISIPFKIDTEKVMEHEIVNQLNANPTAQTYYEAARYYEEQKLKYPLALSYLNKAIELGGDTYYFHRVKSLVEAALGDYKAALKSAEKSLELSRIEEKDEFVRKNEKNITLWNKKLKP